RSAADATRADATRVENSLRKVYHPTGTMTMHSKYLTNRSLLLALAIAIALCLPGAARAQDTDTNVNVALVATPSTSFVSAHETLSAINDGFTPRRANDHSHGAYGNWPRTGTQWVQYDWSQDISTREVAVYWWDDRQGVRLPKSCRLSYWD